MTIFSKKSRALLITFEGIEGSGKSTQIKALATWLKKKGFPLLVTREPGGTPLADRIRTHLLDARNHGISPRAELFLYEVARRDHVMEVIRPALLRGETVLCDRFTDATLAYQGFGRKIPIRLVQFLNEVATGGLKPDLTFLMDLPPKKGIDRARRRNKQLDRLESEAIDFHQRVRRGYLTLARKEKRRFRIIHADSNRNQILEKICRAVAKRL